MLSIIEFNEQEVTHKEGSYEEIAPFIKQPNENVVQWLDININRSSTVESIATHFELHHLTVEDILNTEHLPKFELFDDYIFVTLQMLKVDEGNEVDYEHISFVLGKGYVITFQEIPGDVFDDVRDRIMKNRGYVRRRKSDYLFIRLIDAIVDYYGHTLEHIRNHIVELEVNILSDDNSNQEIVKEILSVKKELSLIRSFIVPLREVLNRIKTDSIHILHKSSYTYLNDIQDHLNYQISSFETFREMLKDLMDLHNNDLNRIMKTLTIISALFIPLTFLAGIYGMNFTHMPELDQVWAYPVLLGIMAIITIMMVIYMKRKRWF